MCVAAAAASSSVLNIIKCNKWKRTYCHHLFHQWHQKVAEATLLLCKLSSTWGLNGTWMNGGSSTWMKIMALDERKIFIKVSVAISTDYSIILSEA
jgi:hypothetical protein